MAPRRIDILTSIDGVQFDEAYEKLIIVEVENLTIPVLSIEMTIKNKLATGRKKDLLDVELLRKRIGYPGS